MLNDPPFTIDPIEGPNGLSGPGDHNVPGGPGGPDGLDGLRAKSAKHLLDDPPYTIDPINYVMLFFSFPLFKSFHVAIYGQLYS